MKNILVILLLFFSSISYSQIDIEDLNLPVKVKKTMNRIYPCVEISNVWSDNQYRFYNFKFNEKNLVYNVTIDSSGFWIRTYREVKFDTISNKCLSIYKEQKERLKEFEFKRVSFEYNNQNPEGYYEFLIYKLIASKHSQNPNDSTINYKKIKIDCNCELLNYYGKKVVQIDGKPLMGYSYPNYDTTFMSSTTTIEYSNNKKNGYNIQYFNSPNDIASVEYYVNDKPHGPYFSYYKNGQLRSLGIYENGVRKDIDRWFSDGTKCLKLIQFDKATDSYKDRHNKILKGRHMLGGQEVYFTNGKIDSTILGGNGFTKYHDNYIDSARTLTFYDEEGFIKNKRIIKMTSFNLSISHYENFAQINANWTYEKGSYEIVFHEKSNIIKEKGAYKNFKKNGIWQYFDLKGNLIKEEKY